MSAVIEKKTLILIPGAEVAPQDGQDPVFRFDLSSQHASQVGETNEALQQMGLAIQMPYGGDHRIQRFVRKIPQKARSFPQELHHQPVKMQLFLRQAGEKTFLYKLCCIGR